MGVQASSQMTSLLGGQNRIKTTPQGFRFPSSERRVLLVLVDAMLMFLSVGGAFLLGQRAAGLPFNIAQVDARWYWFLIMPGIWWALAALNDLYDVPSSNVTTLTVGRVVIVGALALVIGLAISFLAPSLLPSTFILSFLFIALPAVTFWRWTYASTFNAPPFLSRVLIVGHGERARTIARALRQEKMVRYEVVGYVADGSATPEGMPDDLPMLGHATSLPLLVRQFAIHEIVVAVERDLDSDLFQWLIDCQAQGVSVSPMVDLYERLKRSIPIRHLHRGWALHAMQAMHVCDPLPRALKRLADLVLGMVGTSVLALILPPVALVIRLDSPGPVFYRQLRSGRGGQPFSIIKFRTMRSDAEKDGKARWATKDDERITRVGRFLRKTRLDEIPQVLNVLRGEMSVVGPRPERPEFIEGLQKEIPFYGIRLVIKPGLTGWAQIHYPYGNTVEDALVKLQYDFYYLRYWSLWLDLYVVFRTIGVMLKFKGL